MDGLNLRVSGSPIDDDGEPSVQLFNQELAVLEKQGKNTWFTAPWLFAESVTSLRRSIDFDSTSTLGSQVLLVRSMLLISVVPDLQPFFRYRLVRSYFIETKALEHYDPFVSQKMDTFQKSSNGIYRPFLLLIASQLSYLYLA